MWKQNTFLAERTDIVGIGLAAKRSHFGLYQQHEQHAGVLPTTFNNC